MQIDVVYKLAQGSRFDDQELRYSLRSLSNFKNLGKVYVTGFKPRWLQNVIHIPAEDPHLANKDCNLINKILLACHHPELSDLFLNMSDDQIFLKEVSIDDFINPIYDNSLLNIDRSKRPNRWKRRLINTIETLRELNLPTNCYEAHIPTLLDKNKFPEIISKYNYPEIPGMCGNTLYFNTLKARGREVNKNEALRLETTQTEVGKIEELCRNITHLNFSEAATNDKLFVYLQNILPSLSNFEIF
jgi:hypothetical protein